MKTVTLEQQAKAIEKRKAELGISGRTPVPANGGQIRSQSKRALLADIRNAADRQGRAVPFAAKY